MLAATMLDPVPRIPGLPYPPRHHLQAPAPPLLRYNFQPGPLPPAAPPSFRRQPQPQFRLRQPHQQPHLRRSPAEPAHYRGPNWEPRAYPTHRHQYTKYIARERGRGLGRVRVPYSSPVPEPLPEPTPASAPEEGEKLGQREEIRVYMGSETENEELGSRDVIVIAGGQRFIQDRTVLSNASPVFERLLRSDSEGNLRDKVIVDGVGAERMKLVLDYMRRRRLKICCPDTALAMLEPAQRFLLDSLTDSIEKYLLQNVPPEHFCELYRYADARGLGVLRNEFLSRIASDMSRFARGPAFARLEIRLVELLVQKAARSAVNARGPRKGAEINLAVIEAITRWLLAGRRNVGDKLLSGFSSRRGASAIGEEGFPRHLSLTSPGGVETRRNTHDMRRDDGATPWRGIHPGRRNPWRPEMWHADDEDGSAMGSDDARSRYVPDGDMDSVVGSEDSRGQSRRHDGWNFPWRSGGGGSEEGSERRSGRSEGIWGGAHAHAPWRGERNEDERHGGGGGWRGGGGGGGDRGSMQRMPRGPPHRRGHMQPQWGGSGHRPDDDDDKDFESDDGDDSLGWLREGFGNLRNSNHDGDADSVLRSDDSFEQRRRGMGGMGAWGGAAPWRDRSDDGGSVHSAHSGRSRRSGGMSSRGGGGSGGWGVGGRFANGDNFGDPNMSDDRFSSSSGASSAYGGSRRGSSRGGGSRYGGGGSGRNGGDDERESDSSDSDGRGRIVQRDGWKAAGGECGNCLLRGRHDFRTGWMNREELVDENRTHYEERLFRVVKLDTLDDTDLDRVRALADANGLAFLHELTEREEEEREDEEREHVFMGGPMPPPMLHAHAM